MWCGESEWQWLQEYWKHIISVCCWDCLSVFVCTFVQYLSHCTCVPLCNSACVSLCLFVRVSLCDCVFVSVSLCMLLPVTLCALVKRDCVFVRVSLCAYVSCHCKWLYMCVNDRAVRGLSEGWALVMASGSIPGADSEPLCLWRHASWKGAFSPPQCHLWVFFSPLLNWTDNSLINNHIFLGKYRTPQRSCAWKI